MVGRVAVLRVLQAGLLLPRYALPLPPERSPIVRNLPPANAPVGPAIDLDWSAPAECPDAAAVRSDVSKLTKGTADRSHPIRARGSIRRTAGSGWVLSLSTDFAGVTGERTLSGPSCEALAEAAALLLALILDPELAVSVPGPGGDQALDAPSALTPPLDPRRSQPAATAASAIPRWPRPQWRVGAYAGIQTGVVGDLSSSFGLSLDVALGSPSVRLISTVTPPEDLFLEPNVGGRLWLGTLAALGCWTAALGRTALTPCVGLEGARLQGDGLGVLRPRGATVYWSAAEVAMFVSLRVIQGVFLELGGIGLLPFSRPSVYLDQSGTVSRPAGFGFAALGGLGYIFW